MDRDNGIHYIGCTARPCTCETHPHIRTAVPCDACGLPALPNSNHCALHAKAVVHMKPAPVAVATAHVDTARSQPITMLGTGRTMPRSYYETEALPDGTVKARAR